MTLSREQVEYACEQMKRDYVWKEVPAYWLDTDAALRAQCEAQQARIKELDKQCQGYYGEASEGWTKFREAERQVADLKLVLLKQRE